MFHYVLIIHWMVYAYRYGHKATGDNPALKFKFFAPVASHTQIFVVDFDTKSWKRGAKIFSVPF